jgi:uncharacterized protein (TIGR02231 family)
MPDLTSAPSPTAPTPHTSALTTTWRHPPLANRAEEVTFFEDRAEVRRVAHLDATAGALWVALPGVSPAMDDRSLQVAVEGPEGATVLTARVYRRLHTPGALGREALDALDAEARQHARAAAFERAQASRLDAERARLDALITQWRDALSEVPLGAHQPDGLTPWRQAFDALNARHRDATSARTLAAHAIEDADRAAALARARAQQADTRQPVCEACVEVQLDAALGGPLTITATYRVPCALWRPEHLARLRLPSPTAADATLEWLTWATAWQATGEDWSQVRATFSTARPAQTSSPPLLQEDRLYTRLRSTEERRVITVHAHEQAIERAAATAQDIPGVDDGGQPLRITCPHPVTIPPDGLPVRVELDQRAWPVSVGRRVVAARSEAAHLYARAPAAPSPLHPGLPLLAGPVQIARDQGWVGRAKLDFTADGQDLTLGFGTDDAVRVRRTTHTERPDKLSGQLERRTVRVSLSNLSDAPRLVEVVERVPVSELQEVQITRLSGDDPWQSDDDGFQRITLTLPPNGYRALTLRYEVRAPSNVRLPDL